MMTTTEKQNKAKINKQTKPNNKKSTYAQGCAGLVGGTVFQCPNYSMNSCVSVSLSVHLCAYSSNHQAWSLSV